MEVEDLLPLSAYVERSDDDLPPPPEGVDAASLLELSDALTRFKIAAAYSAMDGEDGEEEDWKLFPDPASTNPNVSAPSQSWLPQAFQPDVSAPSTSAAASSSFSSLAEAQEVAEVKGLGIGDHPSADETRPANERAQRTPAALDAQTVETVKTIAERSGLDAEAIAAMLNLDVESVRTVLKHAAKWAQRYGYDAPSAGQMESAANALAHSLELEADAAAAAEASKVGPRGALGLEWGEPSESDAALDELGMVSCPLTSVAAILAKFRVASIDEREGGHYALDVDGTGVLARGRLSPRGKVTQAMVYATSMHAATFAVMYPASSVPSSDPQREWALPHDDVVPLLQHGGWVFWDADERVLGLRRFAAPTSESLLTRELAAGEKLLRFGPRVADGLGGVRLALAGARHRLQPVTIPQLKRSGIKYFTWINPAERVGLMDGSRLWPHGAFAYFYATPEQGLDCYFAVTEMREVIATADPALPPPPPPQQQQAEDEQMAQAVAESLKTAQEDEAKAKAKVEQEAKAKAEAEAKARAEHEAKVRAEQEAKARAEAEAKAKAEAEAKAKAKAEAEAKAKAGPLTASIDPADRAVLEKYANQAVVLFTPMTHDAANHATVVTRKIVTQLEGLQVPFSQVDGMEPSNKEVRKALWEKAEAKPGTYPILYVGPTGFVCKGDDLQELIDGGELASVLGSLLKGLSTRFDEFVSGRELCVSAHVRRFDELLGSLLLAGEAGKSHNTMTATDLVKAHYLASDTSHGATRVSIDTFTYLNSDRNRQKLPWAAHTLLDGLNTRRETYVSKGYTSGTPLHVLVLGGGPMGLYAACELALLGHRVCVYECRDEMSRLNVLKLWPETERALCLHLCLNRFDHQFANGSARANTTRLQQSLLKAALMLGVHVTLRPTSRFSLTDADGFDALVDAAGHRKDLLATFTREATVSPVLHAHTHAEPFATRGMKVTCATALVAHFELGDRTLATKQWSEGLKEFAWLVSDAKLGDKDPAALVARYGPWAVAPNAVASSLRAQLPLDAPTEALLPTHHHHDADPIENVICIRNQAHNKVLSSGGTELANLHGPPPSFYWIATLRPQFVERLVARMVGATAQARGAAPAPLPSHPTDASGSAVPLVQWAYEQSHARDGRGLVSADVYRREINAVAESIATAFTNPYLESGLKVTKGHNLSTEKPAAPFARACRLLRDAARDADTGTGSSGGTGDGGGGGGGYADGQWEKTAQVFDFSEAKRMASAAEVITHVNGSARATPLLLCFAGDALQEPFWPEGLGINRGCHNVMDSVWSINQWRHARTDDERAAVALERQALYVKFTAPMSAANRRALRGHDPSSGNPLDGKERLFKSATVDPCMRYNADRFGFRPLRLNDAPLRA